MASLKPRVSDFFGELGLYTLARYFFSSGCFFWELVQVLFFFFSCAQLLIFAKLVRT